MVVAAFLVELTSELREPPTALRAARGPAANSLNGVVWLAVGLAAVWRAGRTTRSG